MNTNVNKNMNTNTISETNTDKNTKQNMYRYLKPVCDIEQTLIVEKY